MNETEISKEKLNTGQAEASAELDALLEGKKVKLQEKNLESELEKLLREQTARLHAERAAHYREKAGKKRSSQVRREKMEEAAKGASQGPDAGVKIAERRRKNGSRRDARLAAYEAHKAKLQMDRSGEEQTSSEGAVRRTLRLIISLAAVFKTMKGKPWLSAEKRRDAARAVFADCWAPVAEGFSELVMTAWNFFLTVIKDFKEIVFLLCDGIISLAYYLWSFIRWIWDCLWDLRYKLESHKRFIFRTAATVILACAAVAFVYSSSLGYEYSYYGKLLGTAKSREDVYETIEVLGDKLSAATGANVSIDVERDIEFKQVVVGLGAELDSKDDILEILTYMKDLQVQACAINVDGVQTVVVRSREAAENILDQVLNSYSISKSGVEYTDISYNEDVELSDVSVLLGEIWNEDTAEHYLKTGTVRDTVSDGDVSLLNVKSTELLSYSEAIEYGTQYIDNASLYIGETEIKSAGQEGSRSVVAEIERVNGKEVGREVVSSVVTAEAVDQVMYRGTKSLPERVGTGTFAYPIKTYTITSRFGIRWGRMHTGVDFAAPTGTKIYAADGGVVTYAGPKGTYGNVVIIDHGGLFETYYAHCSEILVAEGEKIYQGQNIALVGSTGRSTGPHLHFEVRYNGEPGDPLNYL